MRAALFVVVVTTASAQVSEQEHWERHLPVCSGATPVTCCPDGTSPVTGPSGTPPCSSGPPVCAASCGSAPTPTPPTPTPGLCDACGGSATYAEAIDTSGTHAKRTITTTGCPNHYSVCTGKPGKTGCAAVGVEGTQTEAKDQGRTYSIPARPVIATTTTSTACTMGIVGIALNGVSLYSGAVDNTCALVDVDDDTSEWTAFDMCSGHAQAAGDYHYHFPPSCLLAQAEAARPTATGHSTQVGWASDGFPVYGPLYTGGVAVQQSDLDSCGGKAEELPLVDDFKYRYYFTGPTSNLRALPTNPKPAASDYPFLFACLRGCTYASLTAGTCTAASTGVSASYAAAPTVGYTAQFAGYGPDASVNYAGKSAASAFISGGVCGGSPVFAPTPAPNAAVPAPAPTTVPVSLPTKVPVPLPTKVPRPSPSKVPVPLPSPRPTVAPTMGDTATVSVALTLTGAAAPPSGGDKATLKTKVSDATGLDEGHLKHFDVASAAAASRRRLLSGYTWTVTFEAVASLSGQGAADATALGSAIAANLASAAFTSAVGAALPGLAVDPASVTAAAVPRPVPAPTRMPLKANPVLSADTSASVPKEENDASGAAAAVNTAIISALALLLVGVTGILVAKHGFPGFWARLKGGTVSDGSSDNGVSFKDVELKKKSSSGAPPNLLRVPPRGIGV